VTQLRVVFAGTPDFAVPHLLACRRAGVEVAAVYTQPDRPAGRGRKLMASPVKQAALDAGLRIEQPENFKSRAEREQLASYAPDLIVVVAYGLILSKTVLQIPRLGCWNMHASLLPRWRGAAPIQRAILAGDAQTGVCLMQMEAGLDSGPVLLEKAIDIARDATGGSLHDQLAELGAELLADGLDRVLARTDMPARPQSHDGVVYAHKLDKSEAKIDWGDAADALERKVRAFDPWPIAEADISGETVRIWQAVSLPSDAAPGAVIGSIVAAGRDGIDVACGTGVLRILQLQRAGGRRITATDYLNARPELKRYGASHVAQAAP
jgi:methionyl-tRNA formyltransferase